MGSTHAGKNGAVAEPSIWEKLQAIKIGGDSNDPKKLKIRRRDLQFIFANLAMLLENGLSLAKALSTLARERSLRRYAAMLETLRRKVEAGTSFSSAVAGFPRVFNTLMVHQVRVGERSGTIAETLRRIHDQLDKRGELRGKIIKKLSYPALVVTAGTGLVVFMLTTVVPQFKDVYSQAGAKLPMITRFVTAASELLGAYGWMALPLIPAAYVVWRAVRKNPVSAFKLDSLLIRLPAFGGWLKDVAVYQFTQAFCVMLDSGFVPADAIAMSVGAVGNRAVRKAAEQLRAAIIRGERISTELDRQNDIFPPTMSQLVIVGEQTGNLATAARSVEEYLRQRIERKLNLALGAIEPTITIAMAAVIGCIVLAIYMPMFGMFDAMDFSG